MTPVEIGRAEAIRIFSRRLPGAAAVEVERLFDAWLEGGRLDFSRDSDGQLHIYLTERRTRQ